MFRPQPWKRLVTFALLLSVGSALIISTNTKAKAASSPANLLTSKSSPDSRQLLLSGDSNRRVKVIATSSAE